MLDTHAVARSLTDAQFTPAQADAITNAIRLAAEHGDHVTPDQFTAGLAEVRAEIAGLDTRLSMQIADLRTEQRTDIAGVRTEIANLETRLIRWMVGTVLATGALTFGIRGAAAWLHQALYGGPTTKTSHPETPSPLYQRRFVVRRERLAVTDIDPRNCDDLPGLQKKAEPRLKAILPLFRRSHCRTSEQYHVAFHGSLPPAVQLPRLECVARLSRPIG